MIIGIDISQLAHNNTGVAGYLEHLLVELVKNEEHEFVLFFSSLRMPVPSAVRNLLKDRKNVRLKTFKFPPTVLNYLWNVLHIVPVETLIGPVDVFITSDWTEPPVKKARKGTILYDLIVYKYPGETHNRTRFSMRDLILKQNIVKIQKNKLKWVKKESDFVLCISRSTKKDAEEILGISSDKLKVIYPGLTI